MVIVHEAHYRHTPPNLQACNLAERQRMLLSLRPGGEWVGVVVDFFDLSCRQMRVDLRGREILMA